MRPNFPLVYAVLAVAAIAGSVVSVKSALAGVVILLVTTLLTLADLMSTFMPVRAIVPRRASQNVISREDNGKAGTLVLMAHYDAARTGALFGRRVQERNATLGKLLHRSIGPFEPFFWSMVVILICTVLRLIGFDDLPLTIVQFIPTVVLIASVPLLADISLSGVVPGANDNASAVATVMRLAERYGRALEHFDVWVLLPGAEEGLVLGSRAWIRRHKKELDPANTVFLNLESVGYGTVRWATKEGFVFPLAYHPTLVGLCGEIAEQDEDERYGARGTGAARAHRRLLDSLGGLPVADDPVPERDRLLPLLPPALGHAGEHPAGSARARVRLLLRAGRADRRARRSRPIGEPAGLSRAPRGSRHSTCRPGRPRSRLP